MIFLGIDPGISGGIAALDEHGHVVQAERMPGTELDVLTALCLMVAPGKTRAVLERVHAMPKQGVSSTFKFGCAYGGVRMALTAARIPFEEVTPVKWQRAMACLTRGDKNVSKARAQELFGTEVKITHAIADALLLAEYLRRLEMRMES